MPKDPSAFDLQRGSPAESAMWLMAQTLHADLLKELDGEGDVADFSGERSGTYSRILFGELAMHVAGVQLPANATSADRARGIVEALHRIASTRDLFESITGAPYTHELAAGIAPQPSAASALAKEEQAAFDELRNKITAQGYFEQQDIPPKRIVRLHYQARPQKSWRRRTPPTQAIRLTVTPSATSRSISQYETGNEVDGYTEPIGTVTVPLTHAYTLTAVHYEGNAIPALEQIIGTSIRLGRVSMGTALNVQHTFRRPLQEVRGYEGRIKNETLELPFSLAQAYLGNTTDYPLFTAH